MQMRKTARAVKTVLQITHNGGVAGGGNFFSLQALGFLLFCTDLPCGNEVPEKMLFFSFSF